MPKVKKPRRGTMQFWPRHRAKRIFPNITSYPSVKEAKPLFFAAYKAGMTQAIIINKKAGSPSVNQPIPIPVSVFDAPPMFILGARGYSKSDEYNPTRVLTEVYAENVPKELPKKKGKKLEDLEKAPIGDLKLIVCTQPTKSSMSKKKSEIFEIGLGGDLSAKLAYVKEKLGKEIKATDVFSAGDLIDITAITRGKGFQGVVKKFGIRVRNRKDQRARRKIGVHGTEGVPRILYTVPMAGQMGFWRRTEYNKQVLKIAEDGFKPTGGIVNYGFVNKDVIFIKGGVPGPKKRLVFLKVPMRAKRKMGPPEILEINTRSQQGRRV